MSNNSKTRPLDKSLAKARSSLPKTTNAQRNSGVNKATIAIESISKIVELLKPWELSESQRFKTYNAMLRDDAVWSSWESRKLMVQEAQHNGRLKYDVNNKTSEFLANFFYYCMANMSTQTVRAIAGTSSEYIYNSIAPFEVVTKKGELEWDNWHIIDKLSYIHPMTLAPTQPFKVVDGGRRIKEWYQTPSAFVNSYDTNNVLPSVNPQGKVAINAKKVVYCSYSSSPSAPMGHSAFDSAYTPWREKGLINDFLIMGVQKDMAGIPILEVPQRLLDAASDINSEAARTIEQLKDQMENLHAGDQSYMIMPSDTHADNGSGAKLYSITFKGVDGGGKSFDLEKLIDQRNRAIHKSLGALNINSAEQGSASYNSLEGQTNIQFHYVKGDCRVIDEMWNKQIFPLLLELNQIKVNPLDIPVWEHGEVQDVSLEEISKLFQRGKLYLPLVPEVVNRYLKFAGVNYRVDDNLTTEELREMMISTEDRSGESDGTSGNGDSQQDMDDNTENVG